MDPEAKTGSKFKTLTLSEAEDAPAVAVIVTEWPAKMVEAGEYRPEADIGPVEPVPPAKPLTDQTAVAEAPPTRALYCAVPPSLTWVGPVRDTCA